MSSNTLSVYERADWGAKVAGMALARRDEQGTLFIDDLRVETVQVSGQFSVLTCTDGRRRVVLTSFLRLVPGPGRAAPRPAAEASGEAH
jgi:hypothetical protein